jgi:hypothetical protein
MKQESPVIGKHEASVKLCPDLVHTARHAMEIGPSKIDKFVLKLKVLYLRIMKNLPVFFFV